MIGEGNQAGEAVVYAFPLRGVVPGGTTGAKTIPPTLGSRNPENVPNEGI